MSNEVSLKYINSIGIKKVFYENKDGKKIYILNNGYKYKEFPEGFRDLKNDDVHFIYKSLQAQSKIDLETIVTPEKLVLENDLLYGYIAPFIEGVTIQDIDPSFLVNELIRIVRRIEQDVKTLSDEGWEMIDFHNQNMLVNQELSTGKIIDTDCYIKNKINRYKENMKAVFNVIIYSVLPKIQLSKTYKKQIIQKYFYMSSQGLISTSEFLEYLLCEIKQYILTDFTINDFQKKLK